MASQLLPQLEIAVQDPTGAALARELGADRIELCSALSTGGLTPSAGLIESVVEASEGKKDFIHVLVRPREGGFVYDASELATAVREVASMRSTGVSGVVVGALNADGSVDVPGLSRLVAAAEGLTVTFHRAIDAAGDPLKALETLMALGVDRVLTSGGAARSIDGLDTIRELSALGEDRIQIMAGGGVGVADIPQLLNAGAAAVHLSARMPAPSAGAEGPGGGSPGYSVTDPAIVRAAVSAVRTFSQP